MDGNLVAFFLLMPGILAIPSLVTLVFIRTRPGTDSFPFYEPEHYWVHWHYAPDYWRAFAEREWEQARHDTARLLIWAVLCLLVVTVLLAVLGVWLGVSLAGALLIATCLSSVFFIVAILIYVDNQRLYQRRLTVQGEVYIGKNGIVSNDGTTFAFKMSKVRYSFAVRLEDTATPVLCFESQYYLANLAGRNPSRLANGNITRILIPPHSLDEARHIIHLAEHRIADLYGEPA